MKTIVQINTFPHKATGNIMLNLHQLLTDNGYNSYVVWGRGRNADKEHEIDMKDDLGVKLHGLYTRITDKTGFASVGATKLLLKQLDEIGPDIIHLHNIHGYYINIEMLFEYIRKRHIKIVWTLHDCWPVTGHCAYFDMVQCVKWKTGCHDCEQKNTYPASKLMDASEWNWHKKKSLFLNQDITIVVPSMWLKNIIEESFLGHYPVEVIYNGIDLEIFKPSFNPKTHKKYSPAGKPIVLGVASEWTERKGLVDFIQLSQLTKNFQFVVVGLSKKQVSEMPENIVAIQRTSNVRELVEIYSTADVFLNPTYEDNFPTTNLEALACGTPVITYDTGGSPESVEIGMKDTGRKIGVVVKKLAPNKVDYKMLLQSIDCMYDMVMHVSTLSDDCRKAALCFEKSIRLAKYLEIYNHL